MKKKRRGKHVPLRTCVGCRTVQAKRALTRVVRTPEGFQVDPSGKLPGRGAYVHDLRACWHNALAGPLARALNTTLSDADRERLQAYIDTLDMEEPTA